MPFLSVTVPYGPLSLICYATGLLYAVCLFLSNAASMSLGFLLIGLSVAGLSCGTLLGGAWLEKRFRISGRTGPSHNIVLGLIFALGAAAIILGFIYVGIFILIGLVFTFISSACLFSGARLLFRSGNSLTPLLSCFAGIVLIAVGIGVNAWVLYSSLSL